MVKKTGLSIVGSSRRNGERQKDDFYPTPIVATEALLYKEKFEGEIIEPATGKGDISEVLIKYGYKVRSYDLINRGYDKQILPEINFLETDFKTDNIITNPPYTLALEFVNKAKEQADKKIAFLLRTNFLESEKRKRMFLDKKFPLKAVYQFSKRLTFYKEGIKLKNSGMIAFAWFVWDKEHEGKPFLDWI